MKVLITESQYINLITEASKIDILVNKLGLTQERADEIYRLAGPLSVWLTNKLINDASDGEFEHLMSSLPNEEEDRARELYKKDKKYRDSFGVYAINKKYGQYGNTLVSVMDWIRVGLNGNVKPYQDLSYRELYEKSKEWHDTLKLGVGAINYDEKNEIIRDYRKDGIGFYWVDLKTKKSDEECNRMGHCGRTSAGDTLYSLREFTKTNDKYTSNRSHITAAIGDGIIYQMKGQKNSKPSEKYHPFIVDLLLNDKTLKGFGSEYESSEDFSFLDLSENKLKKIYELRPELFNNRKAKRALKNIGIEISIPEKVDIMEIEIEPESVHYYLDNDWVVRRPKNQYGQTGREIYMSEIILKNEDVWDIFDYYGDWRMGLKYYLDETNEKYIWEILNRYSQKRDVNIGSMSLEDAIEKLDEDDEIKNAISWAENDILISDIVSHYHDSIYDALSQYGDVVKFGHDGVIINVKISDVAKKMGYGEEELDEIYEQCNDEIDCVYNNLIDTYNDKPSFDRDYTPDIDKDSFNDILHDRLMDIRI